MSGDDELAAIAAREEAATPGPWHPQAIMDGDYTGVVTDDNRIVCRDGWARRDDARFAAHARVDIPALLAEVERLEAILARRLLVRFLWHACDVGLGRSYGHTGDDTQDCIRFQFALLKGLYPDVDLEAHHRVLHLNGQMVGSLVNMETLVQLGVGVEAIDAAIVGVYALQGWSGGKGHAVFLIRRGDDSLWVMDFTTATTDGLRPIAWADVVRRWPSRMLVKLKEPT